MEKQLNVKEKITSQYEEFSRQQKKIAAYILDNVNEVIFENITILSNHVDVSVASVVRFANTMGYSGFPQLRDDLIKYYKEHLNIADRFKRTIEELPEGRPTYSAITQSEVQYLQKSIQDLDQKAFEQAVILISEAKRVFVYGNSSNECLANNLWFRLDRLGLDIVQLSQSGHCLVERLFRMKPDDVIVVFDFFIPSVDTTRVHELSAMNGSKIISVTDTINPSMLKNSSIVLHAKRGSSEYFNSQVVPTAIINGLVIAIAHKLGPGPLETLKKLSKLRETYSYPPLNNSMKLEKDILKQ